MYWSVWSNTKDGVLLLENVPDELVDNRAEEWPEEIIFEADFVAEPAEAKIIHTERGDWTIGEECLVHGRQHNSHGWYVCVAYGIVDENGFHHENDLPVK